MTLKLIDTMMTQVSDRWQDCHTLPEMTLLRLALLRELVQSLHSEKSRCLAAGLKEDAQAIKVFETQLENLRESTVLQHNLPELLQEPQKTQKKKRLLPEALFNSLDREKLVRYDRKWEATIAAEAAFLTWRFWSLDTWVKISELEEWDKELTQKLWPHGLVLFIESSQTPKSNTLHEEIESNLWRGRWIITLHHRFESPAELSLDFRYWSGAPENAPSEPQWKQLYP